MGKYIRKKSKIDGESLALMEVSASSSFGVLTRAKSLALQRSLQKPSSSTPSPSKGEQNQQNTDSSGSYIQLRSRRLQKKPPIVVIKRRNQQRSSQNPNPNPQNLDSSVGDGSKSDSAAESAVHGKMKDFNGEINENPCVQTSSEEKKLELEDTESFNRTTRESTPCSLIRVPEINTSPEPSPNLNNDISDNTNPREESLREESLTGTRRRLPATPEMDEFFSGAEEEQQKQFIEKYNFDPVNEQPLPGRFEWTKVED